MSFEVAKVNFADFGHDYLLREDSQEKKKISRKSRVTSPRWWNGPLT